MTQDATCYRSESRSFIVALVLTILMVVAAPGAGAQEASTMSMPPLNPNDEIIKSELPDTAKAERRLLLRPGDRTARIEAAKAYLAQDAEQEINLDAAQAHILDVLADNPNDVESLLLAGQVSLLKKDTQTAARYYRTATLVAPDNASAFIGLGDALTRLGDEPNANAAFERYRVLRGMAPLPRAENTR